MLQHPFFKAFNMAFFNYKLNMGSAIHEEHIDIFHKDSQEGLENYWKQNGQDIKLEELMILDEYVGRLPPQAYVQQ